MRAGAPLSGADLIVRHYGTAPGGGGLYEDGGAAHAYE